MRGGDVFVVKAGAEFEVLSKNPLHAVCMATPAISEGTLFFRTQGHLVAIAETPHAPPDERSLATPARGGR